MSRSGRVVSILRESPAAAKDSAVIVICVIVALLCTIYMLGKQGNSLPFADRYEFSGIFDMAPGIRPAAQQEVRIAGVRVGRVVGAEPVANGHAQVTMSLDPGTNVYKDARLVLRSKSPLNPMYITLDPGDPSTGRLPSGGVIPISQTQRAIQSFEVLDHLDGQVQGAITSLLNNLDVATAHASRDLPRALDATRATAVTFGPVMNKLAERQQLIQQIVNNFSVVANATSYNDARLARLTDSLHITLGVLNHRDDSLKQALDRLPGLAGSLNTAMSDTNTFTEQLNPTLDGLSAAAGTLPGALHDLTATVQTAGQLAQIARPVVQAARPVVADLRPFVVDLNASLADLAPVVGYLPSATAKIVPWMDDLAAFVYQTSSAFSIQDANGGMGRANVNLDLTNPLGGYKDQGIGSANRSTR